MRRDEEVVVTIEPWRIEHSAYLVTDSRVRIRADRCRRADGAEIGPVYVIEPLGDAVDVFALTPEHEVILVREYHHAARIVALGIVGGGVEGDESHEAAVRRELLEETGYAASEVHHVGSAFMNWRTQTNRVHHYLALGCVPHAPQNLDEHEDIEVELVPWHRFDPSMLQQSYHLENALLSLRHLGR